MCWAVCRWCYIHSDLGFHRHTVPYPTAGLSALTDRLGTLQFWLYRLDGRDMTKRLMTKGTLARWVGLHTMWLLAVEDHLPAGEGRGGEAGIRTFVILSEGKQSSKTPQYAGLWVLAMQLHQPGQQAPHTPRAQWLQCPASNGKICRHT
jgi:hypothetical protein